MSTSVYNQFHYRQVFFEQDSATYKTYYYSQLIWEKLNNSFVQNHWLYYQKIVNLVNIYQIFFIRKKFPEIGMFFFHMRVWYLYRR